MTFKGTLAMTGGSIYLATIWILPVIIAITFHEAAHGYVAHLLGDETAWRLGRVSFNPINHIDPFGTVLLPGLLLFTHAPFIFGYAKPVPVNFRALRRPKRDSVLVAAAGPATNLGLAAIAAVLFHVTDYMPSPAAQWLFDNLRNALPINVVLMIFNLFPIPSFDGGRILVGILPRFLSSLSFAGTLSLAFVGGKHEVPVDNYAYRKARPDRQCRLDI